VGDSCDELLKYAGGSLLDEALAKREHRDESGRILQCPRSYRQHVVDVYRAWCELKDIHAELIKQVARRHGVTAERLLQSSLLCVALHDLGKLVENFQRMMKAPDDSAYREAARRNFRHEIVPLWLVHRLARQLGRCYGPLPGDGLLEVFTIAGHHKFLTDRHLLDDTKFRNVIEWPAEDPTPTTKAALELAAAMFSQQGWQFPQLKIDSPKVANVLRKQFCGGSHGVGEPFWYLRSQIDELPRMQERNVGIATSLRELYVILKGLLMTSDWLASGTPTGNEEASAGVLSVPAHALRGHLIAKVESDSKERPSLQPFSGFTTFQERCRDADGHIVAIAPTGSGKTEAALLWALEQAKKGHAKKLLFLLPTMVTTTSLHKRLKAFFQQHDHKVALVHSTADLIREESVGDGEDTRADIRGELLWGKHFFPPVVAATVD
jgi:CRISPR-associated endonuclease/helicase Cas3